MLTPRMPLYIVEMYAVIMYCSTTAARQFKLGYISEAVLCGMLSHVLYGTYDINGPRYLWWTWHDADPAIGQRIRNAPIGSSIWILSYTALHAALNRWVNDVNAPAFSPMVKEYVFPTMIPFFKRLFGSSKEWFVDLMVKLAETVLTKVDAFHLKIAQPTTWDVLKISFVGSICTPMFMQLMGLYQIFSFDVLGIPGRRTYRFAIALYVLILLKTFSTRPEGLRAAVSGLSVETQRANLILLRAIMSFYAFQLTVSAFGKPETHVSTGCHQKVGKTGQVVVKDIMGYDREEHVAVGQGPLLYSRHDYDLAGEASRGRFDKSGHEIVVANDAKQCEWYTVVGKKIAPAQRRKEFIGVLTFATCGLLGYGTALSGVAF